MVEVWKLDAIVSLDKEKKYTDTQAKFYYFHFI